jgi:hypothetical protein
MKLFRTLALCLALGTAAASSNAQFISPVTPGSGSAAQAPAAVKKTITQAAHGFARGNWLRVSGVNTYALAQANAVASADVVGIVDSVLDANNFTLVQSGYVTGYSGLTGGTTYYLSPAVAGAMTPVIPSNNPKKVFYATNGNEGYVNTESTLFGSADLFAIGSVAAGGNVSVAGGLSIPVGANFATVGTSPSAALGSSTFVKLTGGTLQTISGIAGGTNGRNYVISNAAAQNAVIKNDDAAGVVGNKILTGSGSDLTLAPNATITLLYDLAAGYWRIVGGVGGGQDTVQIQATAGAQNILQWGSLVDANAATGAQTLTFPLAAGQIGKTIKVVKADATNNAITVVASAGDSITSLVPLTLTAQGQSLTVEVVANNTLRVVGNVGNGVIAEFGSVAITGGLPLTGANFTGPITIPSAGTWRVTWVVTGDATSDAGTIIALVNSAGITQPNTNSRGFQTTTHQWRFNNSAIVTTTGPETFAIRMVANNLSGSGLNAGGASSSVNWEKIGGFTPITGYTRDYIQSGAISNTSVLSTGDILWTTPVGNIPYNSATGVFTLTAGKTYQLQAALRYVNSSLPGTGYLQYQWVDAASNTALFAAGVPGVGTVFDVTNTTSNGSQPIAMLTYTPTTNQPIKLRVVGTSGTINLLGAQGQSYANIVELGATATTLTTLSAVRMTLGGTVGNGSATLGPANYTVLSDALGAWNAATATYTNNTTRTQRLQISGTLAYSPGSWVSGNFRLMTYITTLSNDRIGWGQSNGPSSDFYGSTLSGNIEVPPGGTFQIATQQFSGSTQSIAGGSNSPLNIIEIPRSM